MPDKSVKISLDQHRRLKIAAAEMSLSLQTVLELLLDMALSDSPVMAHLRREYFENHASDMDDPSS